MSATTKKCNPDNKIVNKSIFALAWPMFFQALLGLSLGYADTVMLSNYNETAVGAIGNANSILGFLALAFTIISSATGIMVSQYLGADKKDKMNIIYTVSIAFNLVLSVIISLIVAFFSHPLLVALQVPAEMLNEANSYIKIVGGTIFTQAIFNAFNQIFSSNGKTVIGMVLALGMNIINIAGNYMFLYGPLKFLELGTDGVAISTSVSRIIILIVAIIYFVVVIKGSISIKYLKPFPFKVLKELLQLGIPTAGENISYYMSQLVLSALINMMGLVAINARIYANMMATFTYMIAYSAAIATQIVVGHSIGSGDYEFAYKRVLKTLRFGLIVSISIAIVNWLVSPFTFSLFTDNKEVIELGAATMFIFIFLEFGRTTNLVVINSMKAAGDVKFPTILAIFSMWGFSVLIGYILGVVLGWGLAGICIGMAADEIFRGIVVFIRWIKGTWRGKRIITEDN
ncbi:MAG: MATE family efflux transporter [Ruminococcus sp.]|nr:MATE family efflux transporter [Ruminococcus sp.]